jgi:hypothetical protein
MNKLYYKDDDEDSSISDSIKVIWMVAWRLGLIYLFVICISLIVT